MLRAYPANYTVLEIQQLHELLISAADALSSSTSPELHKDLNRTCAYLESEFGFLLDIENPVMLSQRFYKKRKRRKL